MKPLTPQVLFGCLVFVALYFFISDCQQQKRSLSLQEISDRMEIEILLARYSEIMDLRDKHLLLEEIFTEDAFFDATAFGGPVGPINEFVPKVAVITAPGNFENMQHMNGNIQITLNGDKATGRVMCFNAVEANLPDGTTHFFMVGLYYLDKYVRTENGWRIKERIEEASWRFNMPDVYTTPEADLSAQ